MKHSDAFGDVDPEMFDEIERIEREGFGRKVLIIEDVVYINKEELPLINSQNPQELQPEESKLS